MSSPADIVRTIQEDSPRTDREPLDPPLGEGDDDHVILWMLSLTPTQRLEVAQGFIDGVLMIRKEQADRDKDRAMLHVLRRTLEIKKGSLWD